MKASSLFLSSSAVAASISMILSVVMRAAHDYPLEKIPILFNYFGWPSMLSFGLYYQLTARYDERLAQVHYRVEALSYLVFLSGLYGSILGYISFEPFSVICPLIGIASVGLFIWNVLLTATPSRATAQGLAPDAPEAGVEPSGVPVSWRQRANIS